MLALALIGRVTSADDLTYLILYISVKSDALGFVGKTVTPRPGTAVAEDFLTCSQQGWGNMGTFSPVPSL